MEDGTSEILRDYLIEANRALMELSNLDGSLDDQASAILHESLGTYLRLLSCQVLLKMTPQEAAGFRSVLDRLRVVLRFHGEDV